MKYIVDDTTNGEFLQIFGVTELYKSMEYPFAFQVRKDISLRKRLKAALSETMKRINKIDLEFHKKEEAKNEFTDGFSIFKPGQIPVTVMCQRRFISVLIGNRQLGSEPLSDVQNLIDAL